MYYSVNEGRSSLHRAAMRFAGVSPDFIRGKLLNTTAGLYGYLTKADALHREVTCWLLLVDIWSHFVPQPSTATLRFGIVTINWACWHPFGGAIYSCHDLVHDDKQLAPALGFGKLWTLATSVLSVHYSFALLSRWCFRSG